MFEGLRARLERFVADHTAPADPRARASALHAALLEAKVAIGSLRDGVARTERELANERRQREDAERRGRLAADIPDQETIQIAARFAAKHSARVAILERKLAAQRDEVVLAEREFEEMAEQFRGLRETGGGATPGQEAAWRDLEAAGGSRPETDVEDALLRNRMDRAMREAAAEAQLAHLKKKMGKNQ